MTSTLGQVGLRGRVQQLADKVFLHKFGTVELPVSVIPPIDG